MNRQIDEVNSSGSRLRFAFQLPLWINNAKVCIAVQEPKSLLHELKFDFLDAKTRHCSINYSPWQIYEPGVSTHILVDGHNDDDDVLHSSIFRQADGCAIVDTGL